MPAFKMQMSRRRAEVRNVFAACLTDSNEARSSGRRGTDSFGASLLVSFRTISPVSIISGGDTHLGWTVFGEIQDRLFADAFISTCDENHFSL